MDTIHDTCRRNGLLVSTEGSTVLLLPSLRTAVRQMTLASSRLPVILIALLALGPRLTDAQPKACGSEIRSIEVNQTTLHYFEAGEGRAAASETGP